MKRLTIMIALAAVFCAAADAGEFVLYGNVFNADGSRGTASTENSFGSLAAFRSGIEGEIGKQNNGENPQYENKIFKADSGDNAYYLTDVGSTDWPTEASEGDEVTAVIEVEKDVNNWNYGTYVGAVRDVIGLEDIRQGQINMPDMILIPVPPPAIGAVFEGKILVEWQCLAADLVNGYTLYRSENGGDYLPVSVLAHTKYSAISYEDMEGLLPGKVYRYKISVHFDWPGTGYYETAAKSAESAACSLAEPTPTITATPESTYTPTATPTATPGLAESDRIDPQLVSNVEREKVIVFPNPARRGKINVVFKSDYEGDGAVYIHSVTGGAAGNKGMYIRTGITMAEMDVSGLAPGVYVVTVALKDSGGYKRLPPKKVVIIK